MKSLFRIGMLVFGFLGLWQGLVWGMNLPLFLLPGPGVILLNIWENRALLWHEFLPTFFEACLGFSMAILWGSIMALLFRLSAFLRYWLLPVILISQAVPTFAIAPFLVIWLGYGMNSKIAVTLFALFFPITIAFYDGLRRVSTEHLNLAKVMRATRLRQLWLIEIPSALPGLGSGLRMSAAWAPMAAVIGEWVGSSKGLGFLMLNANAQADTPLMFSALLVLILFSVLLYYGADKILKKWIFWEGLR